MSFSYVSMLRGAQGGPTIHTVFYGILLTLSIKRRFKSQNQTVILFFLIAISIAQQFLLGAADANISGRAPVVTIAYM